MGVCKDENDAWAFRDQEGSFFLGLYRASVFAYIGTLSGARVLFMSEYSSSSSHLNFLKDTTRAFTPISQVTDYRLAPPSGILTLLQNLGILCADMLASAPYLWKSGIFSICSQRLRLKSRNVALHGLMGNEYGDTGILQIHF